MWMPIFFHRGDRGDWVPPRVGKQASAVSVNRGPQILAERIWGDT